MVLKKDGDGLKKDFALLQFLEHPDESFFITMRV
jgi:hypothetical protein